MEKTDNAVNEKQNAVRSEELRRGVKI